MTYTGGAFDQGIMFKLLLPKPTLTLKVNGQHPNPPIVHTNGPMMLTLDMSATAYTAPLAWYWGFPATAECSATSQAD